MLQMRIDPSGVPVSRELPKWLMEIAEKEEQQARERKARWREAEARQARAMDARDIFSRSTVSNGMECRIVFFFIIHIIFPN